MKTYLSLRSYSQKRTEQTFLYNRAIILRQICRKNMKREKILEFTLLVKSTEWEGSG
jgi:hypothetical protein